MQRPYCLRWGLAVIAAVSFTSVSTPVSAELKPGDTLDKSNCQEAKNMLPEQVTEWFCAGQFAAEIIEVKDEAFQYSPKFKAGSEANAGKYYVTDDGYMYETATKTWPHYWYGFPFPGEIDPSDPKAANRIMYNHQVARFQVDDVYWFLALKWATPSGFDRSVEFGAYARWYIGRHSGPQENPDDVYLKDLIFGVAPYDMVGVSTMNWWYTDPDKWQSTYAFLPTIRRVRRLTAANSSDGMFGSTIARDDVYGWGGKIQYMRWKLIGEQDMLVPISPTGIEKAMVAGEPSSKKLAADPNEIKDRGQLGLGQVWRVTWNEEDRVKVGYETPGWQGAAWPLQ